jgi:hypothetical protein
MPAGWRAITWSKEESVHKSSIGALRSHQGQHNSANSANATHTLMASWAGTAHLVTAATTCCRPSSARPMSPVSVLPPRHADASRSTSPNRPWGHQSEGKPSSGIELGRGGGGTSHAARCAVPHSPPAPARPRHYHHAPGRPPDGCHRRMHRPRTGSAQWCGRDSAAPAARRFGCGPGERRRPGATHACTSIKVRLRPWRQRSQGNTAPGLSSRNSFTCRHAPSQGQQCPGVAHRTVDSRGQGRNKGPAEGVSNAFIVQHHLPNGKRKRVTGPGQQVKHNTSTCIVHTSSTADQQHERTEGTLPQHPISENAAPPMVPCAPLQGPPPRSVPGPQRPPGHRLRRATPGPGSQDACG